VVVAVIPVRVTEAGLVFKHPWKVLGREPAAGRRDRIGELFDRASGAQLMAVTFVILAVGAGLAALLN